MRRVNLAYQTDQIARFFAFNRNRWGELYPSERWIFERVAGDAKRFGSILDVGCAAGGLACALSERFAVASYVGVDINAPAIAVAEGRAVEHAMPVRFHCADVVDLPAIAGEPFDVVVNLSCADWNVETTAIIDACWRRVRPGGTFVISVRLTPGAGINDFRRSYQHIIFDDAAPDGGERANYVVFNVLDFLRLIAGLRPAPARLLGYGYWGRPSKTAVTPYERLVFAVFAVKKSAADEDEAASELHLPTSLLAEARRSRGPKGGRELKRGGS